MDQVSFSSTQYSAVTSPHVNMVEAAGGISLWALGVLVTLKALGNETGGSYALHEDIVPPGVGPPLHIHTLEDETWYILEGEMLWKVGTQEFHATKGCFIHLPKFVPHTFINISNKPVHMVLTYAPAGFERWFLAIGQPVADRYNPGEAPPMTEEAAQKAITLGQEYGLIFTGHVEEGSPKDTHATE